MGKSLRRHKKAKPRIVRKKPKKPFVKSQTPQERRGKDLQKKLGIE